MAVERPTLSLAQSPLFRKHPEGLPLTERLQLSYERARAIGLAYGLSPSDLLSLSPKFWQLHTDPIWSMDGAAGTLCTLQVNCCAGTLAMFAKNRVDLDGTIEQVLRFDVTGQMGMTELGHGLDIINLETTATLLDNGEFDLHSPSAGAAKFMSPTTPVNQPCVSIVYARTMVDGKDHGIKPFLVRINDGKKMCAGVSSTLLSPRGGSRPVNHALTSFNHVRLPARALLGPLDKPEDPRKAFFYNISRIIIGTLALGSLGVPALQVASTIAARYSMRRTVIDHQSGQLRRIITFQTQKTPIVVAVAQAYVMEAYHHWSVAKFKTIQDHSASHIALGDRCGAQGLFEVNQLSAMHADMRGTAIAEGDLLVISIRLASELLLERYKIPETANPSSLAAKYEAHLFSELRALLSTMSSHRSNEYDRLVLPECLVLVNAIGHRMAFDAAVDAGVDPALISLFQASSVHRSSAAFVELGLSRAIQRQMLADAVDAVYPQLDTWVHKMGADPYISAPFVTREAWDSYVASLPRFSPDDAVGSSVEHQLGATVDPPLPMEFHAEPHLQHMNLTATRLPPNAGENQHCDGETKATARALDPIAM